MVAAERCKIPPVGARHFQNVTVFYVIYIFVSYKSYAKHAAW